MPTSNCDQDVLKCSKQEADQATRKSFICGQFLQKYDN